ncbi:MAG: biosynthetic-type acetolactate synthase large subunit [Candidatus Adiutrix intracellularis]|jgi:acetolactate synthase-1/2/3 large subunit|nr:biosynthetic-type acetolactate synthase large subunit [Candidatus Adiutrix intracellularis]
MKQFHDTDLSGARMIVSFLEKAGVKVVFGYPGGQIMPLYDAIYEAAFTHIITRHEQAAAHAADGYARATGRVGVVLATSGPGATNLVTGLATANMDSVPLVAITGQVPTVAIGNDTFQEADIYGITIPVTKYNYLVKKAVELPQVLAEAFYLASSGRPGAILIDVPKDVQNETLIPPEVGSVRLDGYNPDPVLDEVQIASFAAILTQSRRPVAYIGGGVTISGAENELFRLVTESDIPVVSTLMAKGSFPEEHELSLGLLGMHGAKYANLAIHESDLILALGARFDDRVVGDVNHFAPGAKIVHVDIDVAEIGKRVSTHLAVVGDLKRVLTRLLTLVTPIRRPEWLRQVVALKGKYPLLISAAGDLEGIKPQSVIRAIDEATCGEAIIVTDVGQHQMWAAQFIVSRKSRRFLSSGGLGTMGYGLPAALGAQVGCPESQVVLITGDGGFQMNIQELATIRENDLPVKIVIINNGCLGMVRQWQQFFFSRRYSQTIWKFNPNFAAIAQAYGIPGHTVDDPKEVTGAIQAMLAAPGPQLLDFKVVGEENVLPMIPSGGGQTDFYDA